MLWVWRLTAAFFFCGGIYSLILFFAGRRLAFGNPRIDRVGRVWMFLAGASSILAGVLIYIAHQ